MRMELAHHVADDAGAFGKTLIGIEPKQPHGMHDAAMDRFQSVAHIRQCPVHDGRQRVSEIPPLKRFLQIDRFDFVAAAIVIGRQKPFSHGFGLAERVIRGKRRVNIGAFRRGRKHTAGDVKDFTEAPGRRRQFAADLQQAAAAP
jgi:hypothetical protein